MINKGRFFLTAILVVLLCGRVIASEEQQKNAPTFNTNGAEEIKEFAKIGALAFALTHNPFVSLLVPIAMRVGSLPRLKVNDLITKQWTLMGMGAVALMSYTPTLSNAYSNMNMTVEDKVNRQIDGDEVSKLRPNLNDGFSWGGGFLLLGLVLYKRYNLSLGKEETVQPIAKSSQKDDFDASMKKLKKEF